MQCDDGGVSTGDGCSATCTVEKSYVCSGGKGGFLDTCVGGCGDGSRSDVEECDDGE